ncbi:MAG TPA: PspC domain-containing protein [bacterium]|nr:PspC domain-containing protein [bacterium]
MLVRSRTDRWIAGVCGGLGAYFNIDSRAVRVAFVLLAAWQGVGVLLYLLLVVLLPEEPLPEIAVDPGLPPPPPAEDEEAKRRARVLGMGLVVGGTYLILRQVPVFQTVFQEEGMGVLLIVVGLLILLLRPGAR